MPLDVSTQHITADTAVVTLAGSLTLGTNLKVADTQIQGLISAGISKLVLDLTAVSFVDSAGLGALIHTFGLTQQANGTMRLCGVQHRVAALFQMTQTDKLFPMDPTPEASLAAIS